MKKKINFDEAKDSLKVEVPGNAGFVNGFLAGALAGVAAFFFYGTKKGKLLKEKLRSEFKKVGNEIKDSKRCVGVDCQNKKPESPKKEKTKTPVKKAIK